MLSFTHNALSCLWGTVWHLTTSISLAPHLPPPCCLRHFHPGNVKGQILTTCNGLYYIKIVPGCFFVPFFICINKNLLHIIICLSLCLSLSVGSLWIFHWMAQCWGTRAREREIKQQGREIERIIQVTNSKTFYFFLSSVCCSTRSHFS